MFSTISKGIGKLGVKIAGSTGSITSLGSAIGAVAGPVLAVVAVIAVLAAAFKHLWDTNNGFRENIIGTWNTIKETVFGFCQGIVDRLNSLGFEFKNITEVIKAVWDGFCNLLAPVFEGTFSIISTVLSTVLDIPDTEGMQMPPPDEILSATQKDGTKLKAAEIYERVWNWLLM